MKAIRVKTARTSGQKIKIVSMKVVQDDKSIMTDDWNILTSLLRQSPIQEKTNNRLPYTLPFRF